MARGQNNFRATLLSNNPSVRRREIKRQKTNAKRRRSNGGSGG